jgi:hypothetical protein
MYYLRYYCLFTYIVLFVCLFVCLFCWGFFCLFSSSCVPYATSFYELSVFDCPFGYSLTFKHIRGHVGSGGSQVFNPVHIDEWFLPLNRWLQTNVTLSPSLNNSFLGIVCKPLEDIFLDEHVSINTQQCLIIMVQIVTIITWPIYKVMLFCPCLIFVFLFGVLSSVWFCTGICIAFCS